MEADSKSHLCAISLSQSVCELCVCVTVCVTHLFPLSLFNTARLGSRVGQRRKSKTAQSFQIGSMAEQIRSVIIKFLGLPVILMNYWHWIVCCVFALREVKERQLCNSVRGKNRKQRNTNVYCETWAKVPLCILTQSDDEKKNPVRAHVTSTTHT